MYSRFIDNILYKCVVNSITNICSISTMLYCTVAYMYVFVSKYYCYFTILFAY